jgi:hypothetical protein
MGRGVGRGLLRWPWAVALVAADDAPWRVRMVGELLT